MKRLKSLVVAALLVPAFALAQPMTADDWYTEGEKQYNLGEFDKAADAFKQGFAAEADQSKKPAYLYNVAQAYRQGNRCKDAAFFYKRYLVLKDADAAKPLNPEKRAEIESWVVELEQCADKQAGGTGTTTTTKPTGTTTKPTGTTTKPTGTTATKPTGTTTTTTKPTGTPNTTGQITAPTGGRTVVGQGKTTTTPATVAQGNADVQSDEVEDDEESIGATYDGAQPQLVSARLLMGGSRVGMGDLDVGVRGAFALIGGYPVFKQDKLVVEAGAGFTYSPMAYRNDITNQPSRASLTGAFLNGAATYTVAPKISARGDLGLGVLALSGLEMSNPFTEGGLGTTGALTMFHLRLGVSADYEITPNIVATATPFAFSYSPAKSGLRADSITQIQFMLGVGYRI